MPDFIAHDAPYELRQRTLDIGSQAGLIVLARPTFQGPGKIFSGFERLAAPGSDSGLPGQQNAGHEARYYHRLCIRLNYITL